MMSSDSETELLERFRSYLQQRPVDSQDAASSAPEVDLYSLFTELSALKSEVKLESRQLKSALQQFGELFETLRSNNNRLNDELNRRLEQEAKQQAAIEQPLLLELLELRDSLAAGVRSAETYSPGWLARHLSPEQRFIDGLCRGQEMTLQKLDEALERYGVARIEAEGEQLTPQCMRAVGIEHRQEVGDGEVLGIVRDGYRRDGNLLRMAQVVVNKSEN